MSEYPSYPPPAPLAAPQTNTLAIVSLISGLVGFVFWGVGAIVAVVTGHMAKKQIRESMGQQTGDGLATAGLILGYAEIALLVIGCLCYLAIVVFGILGSNYNY
jgi:hypothetical protein